MWNEMEDKEGDEKQGVRWEIGWIKNTGNSTICLGLRIPVRIRVTSWINPH